MENKKINNFQWKIGYFHIYYRFPRSIQYESAAGVVVSCKIPILATRVRFPGGAFSFYVFKRKEFKHNLKFLPDGELNPGLPRDRRGSLPLDYQGLDIYVSTCLFINFLFSILVEVQNRREGKKWQKYKQTFLHYHFNVSFLKYFQLWFFIPLHRCYNGFI